MAAPKATEARQTDIFAITVLIVAVALIVFLVIAAIFFFNIFNRNVSSPTEATFLFAMALILAAICVGIGIWAIIKIIRHRTIILPSAPVVTTPPPTLTISTPAPASAPVVISTPTPVPPPSVPPPSTPPPAPSAPSAPPLTNNVPRVSSSLSLGVADVPAAQKALTQEARPAAVTQRPATVNQSFSAIGGSESSLEQAINTVSGFD